jgi:hypothetical protein
MREKTDSKKNKSIFQKKSVRTLYYAISIFVAIVAVVQIYRGLYPVDVEEVYYNYNINRDVNYKVYLKDNDFYEEEYLDMDKQYTSELIDYIDIDFSYLFTGSKLTDISYSYDVSGAIVGEYENTSSGKSEIWRKKYTLLDAQSFIKNSSTTFDVNQNIKFDYQKYSEVVSDFRSRFKLAIDANFVMTFDVTYTGKINGTDETVSGTDTIEISIPLSKTTLAITTKYDKNTNENLTSSYSTQDLWQVCVSAIVLIILTILFLLNKDKLITDKKTEYMKIRDKIMKDYKEIIVEVTSDANLDKLEILEIKTFDDMIDIEEELKSPILSYEIRKDKECWFVVVNDKYAYRYILNSKSIKNM